MTPCLINKKAKLFLITVESLWRTGSICTQYQNIPQNVILQRVKGNSTAEKKKQRKA